MEPPNLFKCCSAGTGLKILENGKLRFTPPNEFNDPFDQNPVEHLNGNDLRQLAEKQCKIDVAFHTAYNPGADYDQLKQTNLPRYVEHANRRYLEIQPGLGEMRYNSFSKQFGVVCFTEHESSLLMWAHYADKHEGCVIEFAFANEPFSRTHNLNRVKYCKERPVIGFQTEPNDYLYWKSSEWEYESEWRMCNAFEDLEELQMPSGPMYFAEAPARTIVSVFLGARIADENVSRFWQVLQRPDRKSIKLFQAKPDSRRFALNYVPLA